MTNLPSRCKSTEPENPDGSSQWFYKSEGTTNGPITFQDLRALARKKVLGPRNLVWQDEIGNPQPASSVLGLIPIARKKPKQDNGPPINLKNQNPYATPVAGTIADGPPGGLYLPHLRRAHFLHLVALILLSLASLSYASMLRRVIQADFRSSMILISIILALMAGGLALVYLCRAWNMLQVFGAHLTGSKAVGFLAIPFFNALWLFVSLYGWAKYWNYCVRKQPGLSTAQRVWRPMFFIFPILFLISQTLLLMYSILREWPADLLNRQHQIFLVLQLTTLVVGLLCWYQITNAINFLARKKS